MQTPTRSKVADDADVGIDFDQQLDIAAAGTLLEQTRDINLVPDQLPVFRGWEFRAPTSLQVTLPPA